MIIIHFVRIFSARVVGRHAWHVINPCEQLTIWLQHARHLAQSERQIEKMVERGRNDKSVKAFICPRNSLGYRSDEEEGMHLRGTKRINPGDELQIITLKINRQSDRATADVENRPPQIGKAKGAKDHRAGIVVHAQAVRWTCLIGSLAGIEKLSID